jgi:hypothetical protein
MKYDRIIAIDPDCDKSGLAFLSTHDSSMYVIALSFPTLIDQIKSEKECADKLSQSFIVYVEASWLIFHNWHTSTGQNHKYAAAIGNKTGRNHETGRKIVEMCRHYGINVQEVPPLRKCWKGKDGKITHEEISQFIPGLPNRTNQEERDAALIAWAYVGYLIRVK